MRPPARSGQILLLGALILMALLIAVPAIIFLNHNVTSHSVNNQKRLKGRVVAEEGAAYAIQQMTALGAAGLGCPNSLGFDGNTPFKSSQGGEYTISCTPDSPQNYEATLIVSPKDFTINSSSPPTIAGSSILTIVSQHTVGIKLPTGLAVSAAAQLGAVPSIVGTGDFRVHWGPIVLLDPTTVWDVTQNAAFDMNTWQYPRKFSVGPITGTGVATNGNTDQGATLTRCGASVTNCLSCPNVTDQQEYWACSSTGFSNPIDMTTYANLAATETNIVPPTCNAAAPAPAIIPTTPNGGYFDLTQTASGCQNGTAFFNSGYTVTNSTSVIYVNGGNVDFEDGIHMDFKQPGLYAGGAFITTGNLIVNGVTLPVGTQADVREPPTYNQEYPYRPTWWGAPCPGYQCTCAAATVGGPCSMPFRGFLYVQGTITVQTAVNPSNFVMSGVLRADQQLKVTDSNHFLVYYDDQINHTIRIGDNGTSQFELQVDSTTAIQ